MTIYAQDGKICLTTSDTEMLYLCRPNSMLYQVFVSARSTTGWVWQVRAKDYVLQFEYFQAIYLLQHGIPQMQEEKELMAAVYTYLSEHSLLPELPPTCFI